MDGRWNADSPVRAVNGQLVVGKVENVGFSDMQSCWIRPWRVPPYDPWVEPVVRPVVQAVVSRPEVNKTETAFKIVKRLMERGTIPEMTVEQFVAAVEDVARAL
jgi:hypothetical protein